MTFHDIPNRINVISTEDANKIFKTRLSELITNTLRILLEEKHLYQRMLIPAEDLFEPIIQRGFPENANIQKRYFSEILKERWKPVDNASSASKAMAIYSTLLEFMPPDVKMFCPICKRIEPFNSVSAVDFLTRERMALMEYSEGGDTVQVFVLSYLCQGCKQVPEVSIVRREGVKLITCGRAPIEELDIPKFIPKDVQRFYRGALLAHHSGQTLAGIFLLRTTVEQWVRLKTDMKEAREADEVMKKYMELLPDDFKRRFPSFADIYNKLSEDIHKAIGSTELFDYITGQITEHFDALRLYRVFKE